MTQIRFLKSWLCPYLEKGWISCFSVSKQLTKLGRTKCVQEFYNWAYAICKVVLVPVKLSFPTVLWARNGICSTYWLLASSFYQCNSRFGFIEVHKLLKLLKVVWPVLFSCKSTNLYIHRTGLLVRFDFYFSTPKCEGVKPPQVVQVTPEVTSWVHYMQEVTTRANDCLGKSIILEASHREQTFPLVLKWLAQDQVP